MTGVKFRDLVVACASERAMKSSLARVSNQEMVREASFDAELLSLGEPCVEALIDVATEMLAAYSLTIATADPEARVSTLRTYGVNLASIESSALEEAAVILDENPSRIDGAGVIDRLAGASIGAEGSEEAAIAARDSIGADA